MREVDVACRILTVGIVNPVYRHFQHGIRSVEQQLTLTKGTALSLAEIKCADAFIEVLNCDAYWSLAFDHLSALAHTTRDRRYHSRNFDCEFIAWLHEV